MNLSGISNNTKRIYNNFVAFVISLFKNILPQFFKQTLPQFLKENFYITTGKNVKITAIVITAVLETLVIVSTPKFIASEYGAKWLLYAVALILPLIVGLTVAFTIHIKNNVINHFNILILISLLTLVTVTMTECLNDIFVYDMTYFGFIGNFIFIFTVYSALFAITGSMRISILINSSVFFSFALTHAYIVEFRGTPFIPMDLLGASTAVGVAGTYDYSLTPIMIIAFEIFLFLAVIGIKTKTPKFAFISKIIMRGALGLFALILAIVFFFTSFFTDLGIKPDFWNQSRGYRNFGFAFSFLLNTKYLYMSEPEGYNPDDVSSIVSSTVNSGVTPHYVNTASPNIICIMNESLADMAVLGNLTTNEDYMPFMRSLTENTIKGNLYVPVIGGGTSNTEFEFLTGHTTAFLPSGSNAYMLYIKDHIGSMVSTLKGQGYYALAFHPYYASGWNRVSVYNNLGFNLFKSLESIFDVSLMDRYVQNGSDPDYLQSIVEELYPDSNMLLRQYISDSYDYRVLIEDFENRDKNIPYFTFNVTMQNHGGYTTPCSNFEEEIFATSTTKDYNKANRYLSLVKKSDDAFKGLIEYFSTVKEPTIICMFGDHQPSIETDFVAEALGVNNLFNLSTVQEQNRHITPIFIWANYDIEEATIERLSSNYLSSLVLKTAGVQLTEYNKYLLTLMEELPVIDTVGYIDKDGNYYRWSDSTSYSQLLREYERIQYNNIFDRANIDMETFYLPGYVIPDIEIDTSNTQSEGVIK